MDDPFDLQRYVDAQRNSYAQALRELQAGAKRSHWMWFIFPQLAGLGTSATAQHYAIRGLDEAKAYLAHPLLGARLRACTDTVLGVSGPTAHAIFGTPDDLKFGSSMTLFARAEPADSRFRQALVRYSMDRTIRARWRCYGRPDANQKEAPPALAGGARGAGISILRPA